jgi:hypothetical protein
MGITVVGLLLAAPVGIHVGAEQTAAKPQFVSLFNGKDFTGWKVPVGDNGHWRVVDGVIDYDAQSEAKDDKNLWTEQSFGDFILRLDWHIKEVPYTNPNVFIILPDGSHKKDETGREMRIPVPDSDSGVYIRGTSKAQINIWNWPVGSGEVYGYRTDSKMPAPVRAAVTPSMHADRHIGEWNTFEITMRGTRLSVVLNGQKVIDDADLPGIPATGPLALQHHGSKKGGVWTSSPSLMQFRNIEIAELK